jgi:hypothetical protein
MAQQRFFEFDSDPTIQGSAVTLTHVDLSRVIAVQLGNQFQGAPGYTVGLLEEHSIPAQPISGLASFTTATDALTAAQLWRDRIATLHGAAVFQWNANDDPHIILYFVNVALIAAVQLQHYPSGPPNWGVSLLAASGHPSPVVGFEFFNDEASATAEAQLWRDRAEATK